MFRGPAKPAAPDRARAGPGPGRGFFSLTATRARKSRPDLRSYGRRHLARLHPRARHRTFGPPRTSFRFGGWRRDLNFHPRRSSLVPSRPTDARKGASCPVWSCARSRCLRLASPLRRLLPGKWGPERCLQELTVKKFFSRRARTGGYEIARIFRTLGVKSVYGALRRAKAATRCLRKIRRLFRRNSHLNVAPVGHHQWTRRPAGIPGDPTGATAPHCGVSVTSLRWPALIVTSRSADLSPAFTAMWYVPAGSVQLGVAP